jgi:hypothetical protein
MGWDIEYYEQLDGTQPAEVFEDALERDYPKLRGKLLVIIDQLEQYGPQTGGGMVEKCHNLPIWEMRAIFSDMLARELFGFDGSRVVLLHGYVKRVRQPASTRDLNDAGQFWQQYLKTRRVSPELPEDSDGERAEGKTT